MALQLESAVRAELVKADRLLAGRALASAFARMGTTLAVEDLPGAPDVLREVSARCRSVDTAALEAELATRTTKLRRILAHPHNLQPEEVVLALTLLIELAAAEHCARETATPLRSAGSAARYDELAQQLAEAAGAELEPALQAIRDNWQARIPFSLARLGLGALERAGGR